MQSMGLTGTTTARPTNPPTNLPNNPFSVFDSNQPREPPSKQPHAPAPVPGQKRQPPDPKRREGTQQEQIYPDDPVDEQRRARDQEKARQEQERKRKAEADQADKEAYWARRKQQAKYLEDQRKQNRLGYPNVPKAPARGSQPGHISALAPPSGRYATAAEIDAMDFPPIPSPKSPRGPAPSTPYEDYLHFPSDSGESSPQRHSRGNSPRHMTGTAPGPQRHTGGNSPRYPSSIEPSLQHQPRQSHPHHHHSNEPSPQSRSSGSPHSEHGYGRTSHRTSSRAPVDPLGRPSGGSQSARDPHEHESQRTSHRTPSRAPENPLARPSRGSPLAREPWEPLGPMPEPRPRRTAHDIRRSAEEQNLGPLQLPGPKPRRKSTRGKK